MRTPSPMDTHLLGLDEPFVERRLLFVVVGGVPLAVAPGGVHVAVEAVEAHRLGTARQAAEAGLVGGAERRRRRRRQARRPRPTLTLRHLTLARQRDVLATWDGDRHADGLIDRYFILQQPTASLALLQIYEYFIETVNIHNWSIH